MQPGVVIGNRFTLETRAGSGGMGVVFRATDEETGAAVAVKLLARNLAQDIDRFQREADTLQQFDHPAIVRYVHHGHTMAGQPYLVTEWIAGQTLADRLREVGMSVRETLQMTARISQGVALGHREGIIHRDIKPENILFPGGDVAAVKIIDFGIALNRHDSVRVTEAGTALGTPSYMSPEQARAEAALDARSDVFAIGCVLYECLTGQVAFSGSNPLAVQAKILMFEPPRPRQLSAEVSAELDTLVMSMLAKDPASRPADAADVVQRLSRLPDPGDGRRVRRNTADQATVAISERSAPSTSIVLVAASPTHFSKKRADATEELAKLAAIRAAAEPFGVPIYGISGGAFITEVKHGKAESCAATAAHVAVAMRRALPELYVSLTLAGDDSKSAVLDRGADSVELSVRQSILASAAGQSGGAILCDPDIAALLGEAWHPIQLDSSRYKLNVQ